MTEPGVDVTPAPEDTSFKPLGFGDILERAFKICWQNKKAFATVIGVFVIPPNILFVIALALLPPELFPAMNNPLLRDPPALDIDPEALVGPALMGFAALVLAMIGWAAANGAGYFVAAGAHAGEHLGPKVVLKAGLRKLHSVLWILILSGLLPFLTFALVFAPGLVAVIIVQDLSSFLLLFVMTVLAVGASVALWILFSLSVPTVIAEKIKGTTALRRSSRLVKRNFWWTAGVVLASSVAGWIIGSLITAPVAIGSMSAFSDMPALDLSVRTTVNMLSIFITLPFQVTVIALLYIDARFKDEVLTPEQLRTELHNSLR